MRLFFLLLTMLTASLAFAADAKKDPFIDAASSAADIKVMQGQIDPAVHKAVAEALKAEAPPLPYYQTAAYGSVNTEIMTKAFNEAKLPDCLHSEGLKNQFTFFLSGYLALPFIPIAWLRGKCV